MSFILFTFLASLLGVASSLSCPSGQESVHCPGPESCGTFFGKPEICCPAGNGCMGTPHGSMSYCWDTKSSPKCCFGEGGLTWWTCTGNQTCGSYPNGPQCSQKILEIHPLPCLESAMKFVSESLATYQAVINAIDSDKGLAGPLANATLTLIQTASESIAKCGFNVPACVKNIQTDVHYVTIGTVQVSKDLANFSWASAIDHAKRTYEAVKKLIVDIGNCRK
eukprot:NODE_1776_length_1387_cov_2.812698_g1686_i0.p1 GENE.NODE_1776_length_1387_cov_2.812698_g1686_i0~~NODE_1776_length_1387_cov_2.812698_g1686_i0.p1  ORF type:complete len:223 (-),score=22.28 NODE_1776_length_1387_cov_2.812698_g1686_i0:116-784(-)